jgi:hypothetical protein
MGLKHDNNKKIVCEICDRSCTSEYRLQIHLITQHFNEERMIKCEFKDCKHNFTLKSQTLPM